MGWMRNRKGMRQNEDLLFCVRFIGGFYKAFVSHDCADETDAGAFCEWSSETPACP